MNLIYHQKGIRILEHTLMEENDFTQVEQQLTYLPTELQEKINKYSNRIDRCLRIGGKRMLQQLIEDFGMHHLLGLEQLAYTAENKSHLGNRLFFSMAHSGKNVITAASIDHRLGIDIEEIRPIQLIDYISYLSDEELFFLQRSIRPVNDFYVIWTKKEALSKLLGLGITMNFKEITVLDKEVQMNTHSIRFEEIHSNPNYKIMLAYQE